MTRQPHVAKPTTIPKPPNAKAHIGTGAFRATSPYWIACQAADSGPIALATSFEPWEKATKHAVMICRNTKIRSTCCN